MNFVGNEFYLFELFNVYFYQQKIVYFLVDEMKSKLDGISVEPSIYRLRKYIIYFCILRFHRIQNDIFGFECFHLHSLNFTSRSFQCATDNRTIRGGETIIIIMPIWFSNRLLCKYSINCSCNNCGEHEKWMHLRFEKRKRKRKGKRTS